MVDRFKAAVDETVALIESDPERTKAASNAYLKMPDEIMASISVPEFSATVDPERIDLWIDMMVPMGLLKSAPVATDLIK